MPNTLPPGAISIWIGRFLASAPGFSPEQIDLMVYPYATNGLLIQGLLQIHRDYCLQAHPDCQDCALAHNGPRP